MSVISVETAMLHLRADAEDVAMVQMYLDAAEDAASRFMGRALFADADSLADAKSGLTALHSASREQYQLATSAAAAIPDHADRSAAVCRASDAFDAADHEIRRISDGVVVNPSIAAACLLIVGHLHANREDVVIGASAAEIPLGSRSLLFPYRLSIGV